MVGDLGLIHHETGREPGSHEMSNPIGETMFTTPSDHEIVVRRTVDAPRELVFEAWTNPEHLRRWMLGPGAWTMPICEIDLRAGGAWRFGWRSDGGEQMEMGGRYQEVVRPERIVCTESWGPDWPETQNTLVLSENDGRTLIEQTIAYPFQEVRDAALETGMLEGMAAGLDRLAAFLKAMPAGPI